jgi:hypothetical protein
VVTHEWYWRNKDFHTAGKEIGWKMRLLSRDELPGGADWSSLIIWGDSSMFSDTGVGGLTQAYEFQRGLDEVFGGQDRAPKLVSAATVKGKGSRHMGAALVAQMLHWEKAPDGTVPPHKRPLLRVHARCKELIRTLPALPVAPNDPEDVDTTAEDHPFDGLKMMLLANPHIPAQPERQGRDENQRPGFIVLHSGGPNPTLLRRHRPKKPLLQQPDEWSSKFARYSTGYRPGRPIAYGEEL